MGPTSWLECSAVQMPPSFETRQTNFMLNNSLSAVDHNCLDLISFSLLFRFHFASLLTRCAVGGLATHDKYSAQKKEVEFPLTLDRKRPVVPGP